MFERPEEGLKRGLNTFIRKDFNFISAGGISNSTKIKILKTIFSFGGGDEITYLR